MRATRDLLRRRLHLVRKRGQLLAHIQNTRAQYNLPAFARRLAYPANRDGVSAQFADPSVRKSIDVDLALIDQYDTLIVDLELTSVREAKRHDAHRESCWRALPARRAKMLAQELAGFGGEQAHVHVVPLHLHLLPNPPGRCTVVRGLDLDAAIEVHRALAVPVIAKWLERQRAEGGLLLGKHHGDLPFRRAVNASIRPALFPVIEISLRFIQTLEAETFQRRSLSVAYTRLNLAFAIRISDSTGHGHRPVVCEQVSIKRIESRIIDVRSEDSFAQVVEHDDSHTAAQSTKRFLVEISPCARAGMEDQ